jgi:uncharacterized protein (DUF2225 family)
LINLSISEGEVELLNPDWNSNNKLFEIRTFSSCLYTAFSSTFETILRILTGL